MRKILFLMITVCTILTVNSQTASPELISCGGESFQNSTYLLDWSSGECMTETFSAGNYVLSQGFQQNEYVVTGVENLNKDILISVFPNPASDFICLNFARFQNFDNVTYELTDLSGKVLITEELKSDIEQINFSNHAKGAYFITVSQNNQIIKIFKIIKN